jgi:hypothetical protein
LFHISDGESSERRIFRESFTAHWLGGFHDNQSRVTILDEFWFFFSGFTSSSVDLGFDFLEFAGNVSGVAIQNWAVTVLDLTGVVHDDDLSEEGINFLWGIVL